VIYTDREIVVLSRKAVRTLTLIYEAYHRQQLQQQQLDFSS